MYKRKTLGNKSQELTNLNFSGRLFASENISWESTACVQMPIHSAWFINNVKNAKSITHGKNKKYSMLMDTEKLSGTDNLNTLIKPLNNKTNLFKTNIVR